MTATEQFEALVAATPAATVRRPPGEGEDIVAVVIDGDEQGIAQATMWTRPLVGGLFDFEVMDVSANMLMWRHLEGPSADDVRRAWDEMMRALLG